jgi:chromosomal replication initiation ATPase DnaA
VTLEEYEDAMHELTHAMEDLDVKLRNVRRLLTASAPRDWPEDVRQAVDGVAAETGVALTFILSPRRGTSRAARARGCAMRRVRDLGYSLAEVGAIFGRHHTTVLAAVRSKP